MAVKLDALADDQLMNLVPGDRTEQASALTGLDRYGQVQVGQPGGGRLGVGADGAVAFLPLLTMPLPVGDGPFSARTAAPVGSRKLRA